MHRIYVDAAYKKGECGIGVYLRNGLHKDDEFSTKIKVNSSVEGELKAIEFGLLRAYKLGFDEVEIYNDCQEAVDRVNEIRLEGYFSFDSLISRFKKVEVKKIGSKNNISHTYSREGLNSELSTGCVHCLKWEIELFNHCADCGKTLL